MTLIKRVASVIEIIALFVLAMVAARYLLGASIGLELPEQVSNLLFRWLPLILLALAADLLLRKRGLRSWGLRPEESRLEAIRITARLLFLGGFVPLVVSLALPTPPSEADAILLLTGLAAPLIGQELYILGFGHRRLSDDFGSVATAAVVAILFMLAHANHAGAGAIGVLFILTMGWQGLVWSATRSAGFGLLPLIGAHLLLLLCYLAPLYGIGIAFAAGLFGLPGSKTWIATLLTPVRDGDLGIAKASPPPP